MARRSRQSRLFQRRELKLQATGTARLRNVARTPRRKLAAPELRADEDHAAMEKLRRHGAELADHFGLQFASIEAESDDIVEYYGVCYADGVIRIRLRHAVSGRLLKESSLVDTLCHELAHLRYLDHSKRFQRLYQRILDEAARRGIYRPGPPRPAPRQVALFPDGESR